MFVYYVNDVFFVRCVVGECGCVIECVEVFGNGCVFGDIGFVVEF